MKTIKIGTRGSLLAMAQAKSIAVLFAANYPELEFELTRISTAGDSDTASSLQTIGGTGVFTKNIETKLLDNEIDMAVHSAKDLPSSMTDGLSIGAIPVRASVEDAWLSSRGKKLREIESGGIVGTGSPRRQAMLARIRPDLKIKEIRGNIQTRIRKLEVRDYDALIMARAGLERAGLEGKIIEVLSTEEFLPAPGQGALAIQVRSDDREMIDLTMSINDADSRRCVDIERLLLYKLNAGCSAAVGGLARIANGELSLKAMVLDSKGTKCLFASGTSKSLAADEKLVDDIVDELFSQGAKELIEQ